jgi:hypothetical protein
MAKAQQPSPLSLAQQLGHTRSHNVVNTCILAAVLLPLLAAGYYLQMCAAKPETETQHGQGLPLPGWAYPPRSAAQLCHVGLQYPLAYLNVVFGVLVCGVFWAISVVQGSTWLIGERSLHMPHACGACRVCSAPHLPFARSLCMRSCSAHPRIAASNTNGQRAPPPPRHICTATQTRAHMTLRCGRPVLDDSAAADSGVLPLAPARDGCGRAWRRRVGAAAGVERAPHTQVRFLCIATGSHCFRMTMAT